MILNARLTLNFYDRLWKINIGLGFNILSFKKHLHLKRIYHIFVCNLNERSKKDETN